MCGILMNVKCLIIIGFMLAVLTIGSVNASKDVDMISNESVSIEDVEIDENSVGVGFHNDSSMAESASAQYEKADANVVSNDSRRDVDYRFSLQVSDDYVVGTENILMVSLPAISNDCLLTLDTSDNVLYNFHPGGLGWLINVEGWNLTPGNHTINLTYPGDDEYRPFSASIDFTCTFIRASIGEEMVYPRFDLTFAKDATGKVQIFVDGKSYMNKTVEEFRIESDNGFPRYEPIYTYYAYINGLNYGSHSYKIFYSDDEKYVLDKPLEGKFNVTYYFDAVEIDTNGVHHVGDEVKFGIFAADDVKKVIVEYNGKSIEVIPNLDDYYDAILTISDLKVGENNITFTSEVENGPSKSIALSVYMNATSTENANGADTKKDSKIITGDFKVTYCDGTKYNVKVYGDDGKPAKTKVTFLIGGKVFKTVCTDAKGIASVKITKKPGTYWITSKSLGKSVTKKLVVNHLLKLKVIKVKSAKKIIVKASLAKINGKYLKGKKITLKVNGKKFTAKTNKDGVAKFTIKKFKNGKNKFYATYLEDTVKCTVKVYSY
jgi:hypothetical protein